MNFVLKSCQNCQNCPPDVLNGDNLFSLLRILEQTIYLSSN